MALVLNVPMLRELFHFSGDVRIILGISALSSICILLLSATVKGLLHKPN
ncbi:MAG: hypothetical protein PHP70_05425 [Gallionella sp.]|nr:hypothetical protein [Gallionella sp.]